MRAHSRRVPRYREIADRLMGEIGRGRYPVGGLMPSELALAKRYSVSRHTMREAIARLRALGLVARRPGVGTRIEALKPKSGYVLSLGSIDEILQYAADAPLAVSATESLAADRGLAARLHCRPGTPFLRIEGVRRSVKAKHAISWTEIFLAQEFSGLRNRIGREPRAIHQMILDEFGVAIAEIRQEISAVAIEPAIAAQLSVAPGSAGLHVTRRYLGPGEKLLQVSFSVHPEGLFTYSLRLQTQPQLV